MPRLTDSLGVLQSGISSDILTAVQCADITTTRAGIEQEIYTLHYPDANQTCEAKSIPPVTCMGPGIDPVTSLPVDNVVNTNWDFYKHVRCSNVLDQVMQALLKSAVYTSEGDQPILYLHRTQIVVREVDIKNTTGGLVFVRDSEDLSPPKVVLCNEGDACHADAEYRAPGKPCTTSLPECVRTSMFDLLTSDTLINGRQPISALAKIGGGSVTEVAIGTPPERRLPTGLDFVRSVTSSASGKGAAKGPGTAPKLIDTPATPDTQGGTEQSKKPPNFEGKANPFGDNVYSQYGNEAESPPPDVAYL